MVWLLWLWTMGAMAQDTGLVSDPCLDACSEEGRCTQKGDTCIATGDDCRGTMACYQGAACTAVDGRCVVGTGDCADAYTCSELGECTEKDGVCVVGGVEDCARSAECARSGRCGFADGSCVASEDAHCRQSEVCSAEGRCGLRDGWCEAVDDALCAASEACRMEGDCAFREGRCAPTAASCKGSEGCREHGRCTVGGWGCTVGGPEDCRLSAACTERGRCTVSDGACVARTDADCAASTGCREEGSCWFLDSTYPKADESSEAGVLGVLARGGHGPTCGPKSDADCAKSTRCRDDSGWCTLKDKDENPLLWGGGPSCRPEPSLFGAAALDAGLLGGIGGLIGESDVYGGGLGSRGHGMGGGGLGLGGLGTVDGGGGGGAVGLGGLGTGRGGSGSVADLGAYEDVPDEEGPSLDPVTVGGERRPRAVRKQLRSVRPAVKDCTPLEVTVSFTVSEKGRPSDVEVVSGAGGDVARCVVKARLEAGPSGSVTWTVRASE